jgi:hypothetical protein
VLTTMAAVWVDTSFYSCGYGNMEYDVDGNEICVGYMDENFMMVDPFYYEPTYVEDGYWNGWTLA